MSIFEKIPKPPYRALIGAMIMCSTAMNYCYRVFYSPTLEAMIAGPNKTEKHGKRFPWSRTAKGQLVASYFYGYCVISLFGGPITEYFGPYWTMIVSTAISGILTIISAPLAMDSWLPAFFLRFLVGVSAGVTYPSLQCLMGVWAPPKEKGKFVACLMGNVLGSLLTVIIVGFLIQNFTWPVAYYYTALPAVLYLISWGVFVSDSPSTSWFCSKEEADHITETHAGTVKASKKQFPPVRDMILSIPVITLIIAQFGNMWGLNLIITVLPDYMKNTLGFDFKNAGMVTATPSLCRFIFGFIFGNIADFLLKREILSKKHVRKGFTIFSHILSGITLLCFLAIPEGRKDETTGKPRRETKNVVLSIIFINVYQVFNAAAVVTCLVNAQDLAPNFAGTIYGAMNFLGATPGFIIPLLKAAIVKENTIKAWSIIFVMSGAIYVISGILFILFGSADVQPWNDKKKDDTEEKPEGSEKP